MSGDDRQPLIGKETYLKRERSSYGFWGATEDLWLGGNWARGEALRQDVWLQDDTLNFCAILSGVRGFLGGTDLPQELFKMSPGTLYPLGRPQGAGVGGAGPNRGLPDLEEAE
jgi:hypothetical protein